jgi:tellurite methyltransferase
MNVIPIVKKILEYRKTGTIIDIGAGQGHHAIFLAEQGFVVTAVDTDPILIENLSKIAKERDLPITAKIGDLRTLDIQDEQWDIVICTFVLHFLQDDEVKKAISLIKSITKPGGIAIIGVHTVENVTERDRKPHLFEPNELKERFADWEILYDWQGLGKSFVSRTTGEKLEKYRADLIAQKP